MEIETRMCDGLELRADEELIRVAGYAAVYNQPAKITSEFVEQIAPGAFDEALRNGDDVLFLINHRGLPLARTASGTLTLKADSKGLHMESDLDSEDPDVRSIIPKVRRGDMNKMSFGFVPVRQEWDFSGEVPVRTINEVRLRDVSVVTRPAYDGTDFALRSLRDARPSHLPGLNMRRSRLMDAALRRTKA